MAASNPFAYGNPVSDPHRFSGRHQEVEQVYSRLRNPEFESTSVVGDRRTGKTSLLHYVAHPETAQRNGLDPATNLFVYVDLQMVEPTSTPTQLYHHVLRRVSGQVQDPEVRAEVQKLASIDPIDSYALADIFDVLDQHGLRVVLLLDEFEHIGANANFGPEFYYGLRSFAIHHNLALITASQSDLVDLSRSDAIRSSPFFNIFATIHLQPFSSAEVQELLKAYLAGTDVGFTEAEVRYLWRASGGNPFLLQMAASKLFRAHQVSEDEARRLQVVQVDFETEAYPHLRGYWEDAAPEQKIILALFALLETQEATRGNRWTLPQLETWFRRTASLSQPLARQGLLYAARDGYRLFCSTFADVIIHELTTPTDTSQDMAAWQKQSAPLLVALPEKLRAPVEQWLLATDTKHQDLLAKWLSDPHTAEATLTLLKGSGAPFEERPGVAVAEVAPAPGRKPAAAAAPAAPPKTAEQIREEETRGLDISLDLTPPPDAHALLELCQWLEREAKAEIEEMAGSSAGTTSVRIFIKRPVPLVEMLKSYPTVASAEEMAPEEADKGPRLFKKRKDTRGTTPMPLQHIRVILKAQPVAPEPPSTPVESAPGA